MQMIRQWIHENCMRTNVLTSRFAAAFFAASILCSCGKPVSQHAATVPPIPVEVATVESRDVPVEMKAIGAVEPVATVQLKSKVQGEILEVHFADGAQVKDGELLFSIDPRPFQAALKRAEANLSIARFAAANATEQAERYTSLIKSGVASKEQTSKILSTAEAEKSGFAAREADVDEARLSIEWSEVRAPISGRAGAALLKAGNIVRPNVDTLVIINQMQPIYVVFSLPENSLAEVRQWMNEGKPSVSTFDPDSGRLLGTGELTFVDNKVDRTSGMITFKATFPNADESLWPGQFVDVTVKLAEEKNVAVIPATAIMEGQRGAQVFVVKGDTAELRKVVVGRSFNGVSVIKDGLQPGELVVTTGQLRITPGGKVAVKSSSSNSHKQ